MNRYEQSAFRRGFKIVAGVDEAGRGPLAGPVVAAAVILPIKYKNKSIRDSKQLTAQKREKLYGQIREDALSTGIGVIEPDVIDNINIHQASLLAMKEAVANLSVLAEYLLVDGVHKIQSDIPQETIVDGDQASLSIASASILAKVSRDRIMEIYHRQYPHYNFLNNKGYATREHREAIRRHGCCKIHRRSFRPVREAIEGPLSLLDLISD